LERHQPVTFLRIGKEKMNSTSEIVNIEEIMQDIRQQILAKKDLLRQDNKSALVLSGKRLSPEFYEQLYQANLVYDQTDVKLQVTPVNVPIIGSLLQRVRQMLHELVIFYVNKQAAAQIQFNAHVLQAMNLLAQELEKEAEN